MNPDSVSTPKITSEMTIDISITITTIQMRLSKMSSFSFLPLRTKLSTKAEFVTPSAVVTGYDTHPKTIWKPNKNSNQIPNYFDKFFRTRLEFLRSLFVIEWLVSAIPRGKFFRVQWIQTLFSFLSVIFSVPRIKYMDKWIWVELQWRLVYCKAQKRERDSFIARLRNERETRLLQDGRRFHHRNYW